MGDGRRETGNEKRETGNGKRQKRNGRIKNERNKTGLEAVPELSVDRKKLSILSFSIVSRCDIHI